jgi:hypothetical protein
VRLFGFVEVQGPGEGVQDAVGDAGEVAALELGVVLDADAREVGDLAAAQARYPPVAVVARKAGLLRCDLGAAGGEEGFDLVAVVHAFQARPDRGDEWWAVGTPSSSDFFVPVGSGSL